MRWGAGLALALGAWLVGACGGGGASGPRDAAGSSGGATGGDAAANTDGEPAGGATFVYVSGTASSVIRVYRLDMAAGVLQPSSMTADGGSNPTYLAFHPSKKFLYAVNEAGASSKLVAFSVGGDGALAKLQQGGEAPTAPGVGPPHLSVHAGGKWIHVAHFGSGHTTVHPILTGGGVGAPVFSDKTAAGEAHQAKQDPTGKFLFVPCRAPDIIAQYRVDALTGALTANNPARVTAPVAGTGPRHMDFHPNGRWAYVLGESNGHVITYAYDGMTGLLTNPTDLTIREGEQSAAHILVHPSGRFVFASLRQSNEIATLSADGQNGRLAVTAHQTSRIAGPRDFTIEASGRYLLVANTTNGTVAVFEIDATDGGLTFRSSVTTGGIAQPQFVGSLVLP